MAVVVTPLSDDLVRAIGEVNVNFSALELVVHAIIWRFFEEPKAGANVGPIVTSQLSFTRACQLLHALAIRQKGAGHAVLTQLEETLKRVAQAEQRRNLVVHSAWLPHVDATKGAFRMKVDLKKGSLQWAVEAAPPAKIRETAEFIGNVAREVAGYLERGDLP